MDNFEQLSCEPMSDIPTYREWAKETIVEHKGRVISGSLVNKDSNHQVWPAGVYLTFLRAEVIKPPPGAIQEKLYARMR